MTSAYGVPVEQFVPYEKLSEHYNKEHYELIRSGQYLCGAHDTPRTAEWCEKNCERYYGCDTVAFADDDFCVITGEKSFEEVMRRYAI